MIGTDGVRKSEKSVPSAWLDDDDIFIQLLPSKKDTIEGQFQAAFHDNDVWSDDWIFDTWNFKWWLRNDMR